MMPLKALIRLSVICLSVIVKRLSCDFDLLNWCSSRVDGTGYTELTGGKRDVAIRL
jgi:hypothetical protein